MNRYTVKHLLAAAVLAAVCSICLMISRLVPPAAALWLCIAGALMTAAIGGLMIHILSRRSYSTAVKAMAQEKHPARKTTEHKAEFLVLCDEALTVIEDNNVVRTDLRFLKQIKQDGRSHTLDQFIHPDDLPHLREQISHSTFLVPVVTEVRMLAGNLSGDVYADCRCRSILCPYKDFARQPAVKLTFTLAAHEPLSSSRSFELLKTFSAAVWEYDIASDTVTYTPVSAQDESFRLRGRMLISFLERSMILHPDFKHLFGRLRAAFIAGIEDIRTELKLMDASADYRWYTLTGVRVFDNRGNVTGYVGQLRNTDNSSAGEITTFNPDIDHLTGLLNRHGMERSFSRMLAEETLKSCAFLLIDIDGFSAITLRLGRHFGEALLSDIAGLIRSSIGEDDMACRITKDVFALLLTNPASKSDVIRKAERLSQAVTHIHLNQERSENVTCSIGISYCGQGCSDYESLYYQADTALAFAQSNGANRIEFYHEELDDLLYSHDALIEQPQSEPQPEIKSDSDFLSQTIDVLSESRELSSSINIVLSLIGHKYSLERCEILEFSDDYQNALSTYHWTYNYENASEPVQCSVKLLEEVIMLSPDSEYYLCRDVNTIAGEHPRIAAFYNRNNIASFIHVPIHDGLNTSGLICYGARTSDHVFSDDVTREIVLISKIMAGYIMRLRNIVRLDRLSTTDSLTGCMNMSRFIAEASQVVLENPKQRYVVVYSDIDRFKFINDTFGYLVGDRVLIEFAQIISGILTEGELLGRIDADKFITLLKYDDHDKLVDRLASCDRRISTINDLTDDPYKIPLRCGIAHVDPAEDMTHIIDKANLARKSVKNIHVSTYIFYNESMKSRILQQKEIEDVMHEALANGEFTVYLQPKFSLEHESIVGAEALVRWDRPGYGVQSPNDFIPIFEDNGFVINLDFYVFDKVCQKLRHDLDCGLSPYPISVNFSRLHLNLDDFTGRIRSCLEKYQIDPKYIEIEITESALIGNEDYLVEVMDSLHDLGLMVAMDDFGSGYSTLNLLKKLPVDILKIDKAFFAGSGSERERLIIANVVNMAKSLDICVVSEGVETIEQAKFLRQVNCDIAQGYLYAHPMDLDTYENTYQRPHNSKGDANEKNSMLS